MLLKKTKKDFINRDKKPPIGGKREKEETSFL